MKFISVPRYLFSHLDGSVTNVELQGYCDSSEQAYCAVIYVHAGASEESSVAPLIASKTKVAPIKKKSIPRLELLACVLLSELMGSVSKVLENTVTIDKTQYWSDSEVALTWIKGEEKRSPWVQNRVKKVKKKSVVDDWDYVHTSINPADIGTRESSALKIDTDQRWWYGPQLPHPKVEKIATDIKSNPEVIKERPVVTLSVQFDPSNSVRNLIDVKRFSSLQKLLNVTAYVLRFVDEKARKLERSIEV